MSGIDALNETRPWGRQGVAMHLLDMGGQAINTASAMGRMFLTMTGGFAELERNLIAERTRTALQHKRDKGEAVSRAPRGLCIVAGRLATDSASDGLKLYGRARSLRAGGMGYAAIAEQLMAEGFKAERGAKAQAADLQNGVLLVGHGTKSGKVRRVPVPDSLASEIRVRVGRLSPFSHRSSGYVNRAIIAASGVSGFHFHQLRHTFACRWLEAGGSIEALSVAMGHSTIRMTERYGRTSDAHVREVAGRVHARWADVS